MTSSIKASTRLTPSTHAIAGISIRINPPSNNTAWLTRMYQGRCVTLMRRSKASNSQLKSKFQVNATMEEITPTRNDALDEFPNRAKIMVVNPTATISKTTAYTMRRPNGDGKMRRPTSALRPPGPTGTAGILATVSSWVVTTIDYQIRF